MLSMGEAVVAVSFVPSDICGLGWLHAVYPKEAPAAVIVLGVFSVHVLPFWLAGVGKNGRIEEVNEVSDMR